MKGYLKFSISLIFMTISLGMFANEKNTSNSIDNINQSAGLNSLELASKSYGRGELQVALSQALLGSFYAANFADFPYIEALCYRDMNYPTRDVLAKLELACSDNMDWRLYNKNEAVMLLAELYASTGQFEKSLKSVKNLQFPTANSEYIEAVSLYGLKKYNDARMLISESLDRWAFDSRFPKLFFRAERKKTVTPLNKSIAKKILSRLYIWEKTEPSFLVLSAPFESNPEEAKRRLKIYREMYEPFTNSYMPEDLFTRSYALILGLYYGIVDETTAVNEFFNMTSFCNDPISNRKIQVKAIYAEHIQELIKAVNNLGLSKEIVKRLLEYNDCIFFDYENDGILNSVIFYKNGRPKIAGFDNNQDGYANFIVNCNFGIPTSIVDSDLGATFKYDEYPFVTSVDFGESQFIMRPKDLQWTPITFEPVDLNYFNAAATYNSFFTLSIDNNKPSFAKNDLKKYVAYLEKKLEGGNIYREYFDKGFTVSSEVLSNGKQYVRSNYINGILAVSELDVDLDGYFETKHIYSNKGELKEVLIDLNKNKFYEYREEYEPNGTVSKIWDSNEDSKWDILFIQYPNGASKAQWIHPFTKEKVVIEYLYSNPVSMTYLGKQSRILKEQDLPLFWINEKPEKSRVLAEEILKVFNQTDLPVVSYNIQIESLKVFATRSGGFIFAEILEN